MFKRLGKFFELLSMLHLGGVNAWLPLWFGMVEFLWYQMDLAAYQQMVSVAVCTVIGASEEHMFKTSAPDYNHVELVPVL